MEQADKCTLPWTSCELLVAFKFAEQGYAISAPLHPQSYDLVVDTHEVPSRLIRVQVKKATYRPQRVRRAGKGDRAGYRLVLAWHRSGQPHRRLKDSAFDYLVAVCTPALIYVVPVSLLLGQEPGKLLHHLEFKPPATNARADSLTAGQRWTPYINQFKLTRLTPLVP